MMLSRIHTLSLLIFFRLVLHVYLYCIYFTQFIESVQGLVLRNPTSPSGMDQWPVITNPEAIPSVLAL